MRTFRADEKVAYDNITNQKTTFGVFHKTCIHVHTPESYDYTLISGWNAEEYKKASDTDIYEICLEKKVFPKLCSLKEIELTGKLNIFNNKKDLLSYLLLAQSLIDESIEIVIITDHHTIEGVKKLETAIEELSHFKTLPVYPEIILGIEISCADKNHVVGIFDNTDENKNQLYKWLSNNLVSKEEGSYQTSLIVLEYIKKIGGIGYIAHIDTSNTFKESFSGAYKKELFSKNKFNMIGLSDFSKKDDIKTKIRLISKKNFKYIIDNDSHNIDNLNQKHIWIKGSKKILKWLKKPLMNMIFL